MSQQAEANADASAHPLWVRTLLIAVAAVECLGGVLPAFFVLSGDLSEVLAPGLAGWAILATLILRPVLAITAVVFVVQGRVPRAIMALGAVVLTHWLNQLPSAVLYGLEFASFDDIYSSAHFLLSPVPALAAMLLAWKDPRRLGLPAMLVCLPTIVEWLGILAFAIGVAIYGF